MPRHPGKHGRGSVQGFSFMVRTLKRTPEEVASRVCRLGFGVDDGLGSREEGTASAEQSLDSQVGMRVVVAGSRV